MLTMPTTLPGIRLVDSTGSTIPLPLINAYSSLAVPAYSRAVTFLADNLTSFPRSVRLNGAKLGKPHRLDPLLRRRPNGYQTAWMFWRTLFFHAIHRGNGYARIERGNAFVPDALHNVLPEDITPFRWKPDNDREDVFTFYWDASKKTAHPLADILHLSRISYDGLLGLDPVSQHEATLQRATMVERYATQFLRKGSVIRGSLEIPAGVTDAQMAKFRAELRKFSARSDGDDDILILADGATLKNSTLSPKDSELVAQGQASTKSIAQITGVPPEFLFEQSESKYNTSVEQAGHNVVRYTFRAWIEQIQAELTTKLLTEDEQDQGYSIRLNPDALQRGDTSAVTGSAVQTVNAGIRTPNEGRDLLELPPLPDPSANQLHALGSTATAGESSGAANSPSSSG